MLRISLLRYVEVIDKSRKNGKRLKRYHNILIQLKGIGSPGNRPKLFSIGPEANRIRTVSGKKHHGIGMVLQQLFQPFNPALHLGRGVAGNINQQNGFRCLSAGRLHLIVNSPDILIIKVLERQQCLPVVRIQGKEFRKLQYHPACLIHIRPEKLQAKG